MNKLHLFFFSSVLLLVLTFSTPFAQLTGIKTIDNTIPAGDNNYQSFTDAINVLNGSGVGLDGVIFNAAPGQTFNKNTPVISAAGPASLAFQRNSAGANPKIVMSAKLSIYNFF